MFGCCAYDKKKLRAKDGLIDESRWVHVRAAMEKNGYTEHEIAQTKACTCPCHIDEQSCLC